MTDAVTTRLPDELLCEIERFAKTDRIDRSAEVRRLLELGIYERKKKELIERYRSNKISAEGVAKELGITIWEVLDIFKEEKVQSQYDEKDFLRDLEALE